VAADIIRQLGMVKPEGYKGSFFRSNLHIYCQKKGTGRNLTFSDKDNSIHLVVTTGNPPVKVTGGRAKIELRRLGPPDPVTGKRPLLLIDRYVYAKGGRYAVLDLATPKGVDNVDAYRLISNSFRWR